MVCWAIPPFMTFPAIQLHLAQRFPSAEARHRIDLAAEIPLFYRLKDVIPSPPSKNKHGVGGKCHGMPWVKKFSPSPSPLDDGKTYILLDGWETRSSSLAPHLIRNI